VITWPGDLTFVPVSYSYQVRSSALLAPLPHLPFDCCTCFGRADVVPCPPTPEASVLDLSGPLEVALSAVPLPSSTCSASGPGEDLSTERVPRSLPWLNEGVLKIPLKDVFLDAGLFALAQTL